MQDKRVRVVYLDKQYVTSNAPAVQKAKLQGIEYVSGKTCDQVATAMPEW